MKFNIKGEHFNNSLLPIRKISVGSFRRRLTIQEKIAITSSTEPLCKVLLDDLAASTFIDLDNPELEGGLSALVGLGLLSAERIPELLQDGTQAEV